MQIVAKNKEKGDGFDFREIYQQDKIAKAESIRYEKKKLEKIKLKQE